ncbi:MAG: ATP-binding protein [Thermoplasmata archaeon]
MRKETAIEIIQNFMERPLPVLTDRDLIIVPPKAGKAVSIIGPRRAGKTYFLFDLMGRLTDVAKNEKLYVNLEDDRLLSFELEDMDAFLNTYYEMYPKSREGTLHLFLDEVQNVHGWERFVRRVMDTENVRVYISGSSSKLLSKEIATTMRGRAISYLMLPFSFREYLRVRGTEVGDYLSSDTRARLLHNLDEYLKWGSFPEIVLDDDENSRLRTLREYVEIMLMRDLVERHRIKNTKVLRMLFSAMLASYARPFSIHKFFNYLKSQGIKVSKNTLYEYFQHFEDAFAVFPVRRFSYSIREIEQSLPKVYQIDNGYAARLGTRHSEDIGRLMENAVAVELLRRASEVPDMEFHYWTDVTGKEVDFLLRRGGAVTELIQVCYDVEEWETKLRETRALVKASEEMGCKNLTVLTWDHEDTENVDGRKIKYVPLWKWMLGRS